MVERAPSTFDPMSNPSLLVAGALRPASRSAEIRSPWDGSLVGHAPLATRAEVVEAIDAAVGAAPAAAAMPSHARAAALHAVRAGLGARRVELAELLAREAGKPIALATLEVDRALFVLETAAEESKRMHGAVLPLDLLAAGEGRWALSRRFPLAPISAITPFNFPLLLSIHKLAPAMACGATMVLKPPPQDPLTVMALGELLLECGYPKGAISIVPCTVEDAAPLIDDPRVRMLTFTGSAAVGWELRRRAGNRKVALELGGNAAVIVEPDADLAFAVKRCVAGGFGYAGQSCISVQRVLVHEDVADEFTRLLVEAVQALRRGDPLDPATEVGPMIDERSAARVAGWIDEAVAAGAQLATGGTRDRNWLAPSVLLDAPREVNVNVEEVFAPLVTVQPYRDFAEAVRDVNATRYGLQAGVFTRDIQRALAAWSALEVGAVVIGDIPTFRVDHMPYGGVKDSGLGREGVRAAMDEMTEERLLIVGA
jgi:acyl-CoA reductase-like NAD-dependent aldehyde dehydrogenase